MKRLLFLVFLIPAVLLAQDKAGSLKQRFYKAKSDEIRLETAYELSELYYSKKENNKDSLKLYATRSRVLARQLGQDTTYIKATGLLAIVYFYKDTAQFFEYMQEAERKALQIDKPALAARYTYYQSARRENFKQSKEVIVLVNRALEQMGASKKPLSEKDLVFRSRMMKKLATSYLRLNNYEKALAWTGKIQKTAYKQDAVLPKLEAYLSYIEIYFAILDNIEFRPSDQNKKKYETLLLQSIDSLYNISLPEDSRKVNARRAHALNSYGDFYAEKNKSDLAIDYYKQGLKLSVENSTHFTQFNALLGIVDVAIKNKKSAIAKKYLGQAAALSKSVVTETWDVSLYELHLAYARLTGNNAMARKYYGMLAQILKNTDAPGQYLSAYNGLYSYALESGNTKKALEYYQIINDLQDSIKTQKLALSLENIQAKYNVAKKNETILKLKEEKARTRSRNTIRLSVLVLMALILLTTLLIFRYRNKNKLLKQEKQSENLKQRLLRSQINPHFTFNVLGTIQHYIYDNKPEAAAEYLAKFSKLLRKNLEFTNLQSISLSEEIEFMHSYLTLEKERKPGLFNFELQAEEAALYDQVLIQPLLVQPLVENSIKHGFKQYSEGGILEVKYDVCEEDQATYILVKDNGCGFKESEGSTHRSMGLGLIKERIEILNKSNIDNPFELNILSDKNGTEIKLKVPYAND